MATKQKDESAEKHRMPTINYGQGSVWQRAYFSSINPGILVSVHGIMNASKNKGNLNKNLMASDRKLKIGHHLVFQQDNEPKHMAKSTQK